MIEIEDITPHIINELGDITSQAEAWRKVRITCNMYHDLQKLFPNLGGLAQVLEYIKYLNSLIEAKYVFSRQSYTHSERPTK